MALAFLTVTALGIVPSPLYGPYRARGHFLLFMITVIYAVYAIGVIGALLLGGHLSDLYGRRRLLVPSLGIAIVVSVGIAASAIKHLGRTTTAAPVGPTAAASVADAHDDTSSRHLIPI